MVIKVYVDTSFINHKWQFAAFQVLIVGQNDWEITIKVICS